MCRAGEDSSRKGLRRAREVSRLSTVENLEPQSSRYSWARGNDYPPQALLVPQGEVASSTRYSEPRAAQRRGVGLSGARSDFVGSETSHGPLEALAAVRARALITLTLR